MLYLLCCRPRRGLCFLLLLLLLLLTLPLLLIPMLLPLLLLFSLLLPILQLLLPFVSLHWYPILLQLLFLPPLLPLLLLNVLLLLPFLPPLILFRAVDWCSGGRPCCAHARCINAQLNGTTHPLTNGHALWLVLRAQLRVALACGVISTSRQTRTLLLALPNNLLCNTLLPPVSLCHCTWCRG